MRSHRSTRLIALFIAALFLCRPSLAAEDSHPHPVAWSVVCTSLNNVQSDLHYIFESAGVPEKARTIESLANLFTGGFGAAGIIPTEPFGFASRVQEGRRLLFSFFPVSDENAFLKIMRVYVSDVRVTLPKENVVLNRDEFVVHFEHGYAFVYYSDGTDWRFPKPASFIPEESNEFDLSASVDIGLLSEKDQESLRQCLDEGTRGVLEYFQTQVRNFPTNENPFKEPRGIIAESQKLFVGFRVSKRDHNNVFESIMTPKDGNEFSQIKVGVKEVVGINTDHFSKMLLQTIEDSVDNVSMLKKRFQRKSSIRFSVEASTKQVRGRIEIPEAYQCFVAHAYSSMFQDLMPVGMLPHNTLLFLGYMLGGPPTIEPEFDSAICGSLIDDHSKVLVICNADGVDKSTNGDLAEVLSNQVGARLEENSINVVSAFKENLREGNAKTEKDLASIGKSAKADYVISIQVKEFSLYEPNVKDLYRGRTTGKLSVIRVKNGENIFERDYSDVYPIREPVPTSDISFAKFKTLAINHLSEKIGRHFYVNYASEDISHGVLDDHSVDIGSQKLD